MQVMLHVHAGMGLVHAGMFHVYTLLSVMTVINYMFILKERLMI